MCWQSNRESVYKAIIKEIDKVQLELDDIDDITGLEIYVLKLKGMRTGLEKALEIISDL